MADGTDVEVVRVRAPLADHQADFVDDVTSPTLVMEGGLGSGKTVSAIVKMLRLADASPGVAGLVVEPTSDLIGTIFLATCDELLGAWGVPFEFRTQWRGRRDVLLLWPGTSKQTPVYLRSGDKPHRIVGFKVGWFIVDEADQMQAEVWRRCVGRMRDARASIRQACAVYTPEPGFNWTWTMFHEKRTSKMRVIEGVSTKANRWNPDEYADNLTATHDEQEQARVLEGRRSAREGLVYRRFSDANLRKCPTNPWVSGDVQLWCDFNNSKMAWCFVSLVHGRAWVFDEVVREDTDTLEQAQHAARYAALKMSAASSGLDEDVIRAMDEDRWPVTPRAAARAITVIGDAAGDHDEGAAGKVSYELIRQVGFTVRHKAKGNPFIEDTVLTVNVALADGWLAFDAEQAPYTTRCIRQQPYGPDGQPLKGKGSREKVKAGLDHGADCIRYGTWFHRPVHVRRGNQPR